MTLMTIIESYDGTLYGRLVNQEYIIKFCLTYAAR